MVMAVGSNGDVSGVNAEEAAAQIPASVKRIIQSAKEIVIGCDEDEIFAMLKDCDMDPNDTVQRLLSIDEGGTTIYGVVSYGLNRRARVADNEHCVQYSEKIQENLSDPETSGSRRENGSLAHLSAAETTNQPLSHSYFEETKSKVWRIKPSDACTPSAQTFATNSQYLVKHPHVFGSPQPESDVGLNSQVPSSASETIHKPGTTSGCPVFYDGSSLRKQQAAASFWSSDAGMHSNLCTIDNVRATLSKDFHSDEVETPQRYVGAESSFTMPKS